MNVPPFISIVLVVLLLVGCQPSPQQAIIVGGSMAPEFVGSHYQASCDECRFPFAVNATSVPKNLKLVCPNCGFDSIEVAEQKLAPADSARIRLCSIDQLNRWDVIAFRELESGKILIKRIVGLPNESVAIVDGDIQINGQMMERYTSMPPPEKLPLVFDSRYLPASDDRFRAEPENSWERVANRFRCTVHPHPESAGDGTCLYYVHRRGFRSFQTGTDDCIKDAFGFNQAISRPLNRVDDLVFEIRLGIDELPRFELRLDGLKQNVTIWFDLEKGQAGWGDPGLAGTDARDLDLGPDCRELVITANGIGNRLQVTVNHQPLMERTLERDPQRAPTTEPLSIGVSQGTVELNRLRIWRDTYYFDDTGAQSYALGDNEFFVLGDNPPLSVDSRHFDPAAVKASQIVGIVEHPL